MVGWAHFGAVIASRWEPVVEEAVHLIVARKQKERMERMGSQYALYSYAPNDLISSH
jgi:hypothetical protein